MKTKTKYLSFLLGVSLSGCYGLNSTSLFYDMWDTEVVATQDAIYAMLPNAGLLMKLTEDGNFGSVDLNGASPSRLVASPDGSKLLVFTDFLDCKIDDDDIVYISDCPSEDIVTISEWLFYPIQV